MKTIATVVGARPQLIKASAVSQALRTHNSGLHEVVIHTGQHYDPNMSDVFFRELGMASADHNLGIHGGGHGEMTGRMLAGIERILLELKPDAVLLYGDTNSTLAGALAAVKLHIPVAHVEAGLRSFNMAMPEEINRIVTDRVSRWLFAPTQAACAHLAREGVDGASVFEVGDVMYDAALHHGARADSVAGHFERLGLASKGFVLATIHRADNTDVPARLSVIVEALSHVAETLPVVWPVHPRTRNSLQQSGLLASCPANVHLINPLGYLEIVKLEKMAALIATDSGGVQKEAFFWRVPCVTLRDETEWVELIDAGWNRLAPPADAPGLAKTILSSIGTTGRDIAPYGDGRAAEKIVQRLSSDLGA